MFSRELKKGSTEMLVLSLLEHRPRHGYEIGKQIEATSGGRLRFRIGSLYPILCRLEDRGLISGRWIERDGERRRRYYRLTPAGRKALAAERALWRQFVATIDAITGVRHA
jgi:PadR family transcriptional regulator, regulatory protein PadR